VSNEPGKVVTVNWLLYVSESRVPPSTDLSGLLTRAQQRNAALNVTGSLIFTGTRFAQYLEGPAEALDVLMTSVRADVRHSAVEIVDHGVETARRFVAWSLAYAGPSVFVDRTVANSIDITGRSGSQAHALIRLMRAFSQA
jgi:hypothetical protein